MCLCVIVAVNQSKQELFVFSVRPRAFIYVILTYSVLGLLRLLFSVTGPIFSRLREIMHPRKSWQYPYIDKLVHLWARFPPVQTFWAAVIKWNCHFFFSPHISGAIDKENPHISSSFLFPPKLAQYLAPSRHSISVW